MSSDPLAERYVELRAKYRAMTDSRDHWRAAGIIGWGGALAFFCLAVVGWFG